MLSGCAPKRADRSRVKSKSPSGALDDLFCCQTKYSVEPGRYSQRSTALPRNDRKLKSGSPKEIGVAAVPAPSASTVYSVAPELVVDVMISDPGVKFRIADCRGFKNSRNSK